MLRRFAALNSTSLAHVFGLASSDFGSSLYLLSFRLSRRELFGMRDLQHDAIDRSVGGSGSEKISNDGAMAHQEIDRLP